MKLTLDAKAVDLSLGGQATVGDALTALKNKAGAEERLLTSALLDGVDLGFDIEEGVHLNLLSKHESLAVETESSVNICLNVLNELLAFKEPLLANQKKSAELIGQPDATAHDEGIAILRDCFDVWNILSESIRKVTVMLAVNPEEVKYDGKAVSELFEGYGDLVLETRTAIEAKDLTKLASVINDGWKKEVETWQGVINALITVIKGLSK